MRRLASRFLLVGLVVAIVVFVILRADAHGGSLVSIDSVKAEGQPVYRAFEVKEPMRVAIEAAGSFESGGADTVLAAQGWLVRRETGDVVWRMRPAQRPARGTFVLMRDTLALQPGTYDAVYAALGDPLVRAPRASGGSLGDRFSDFLSRGGRGWVGDAGRWRFHVEPASAEDRDKADRIDDGDIADPEGLVWSTGAVESGMTREVTLRATAPVRIRLDALFEAADGAVADSAALVSAAGDTLWAARARGSAWAGGSVQNRRQTDTLSLAPGLYRVSYRADRDHAYGSWTANPPWEPWRWGLRIAPADAASASGAIAPLDPLRDFPLVAEIRCVGESASPEVRFEVTQPLDVLVVAVGEFVGDSAYDYATLDRNGSTVWDMRTATLRPAGGADKNRRAEETISLEPGAYTLRYRTDSSHHCGDFNGAPPDPEDLWGVLLLSADGEEAGARVRGLSAPEASTASGGPAAPPGVLTSLTRVENGRDVSGQFTLADTTDVCVMGLGEITSSRRSDWGQIAAAGGSTLWEMTHASSYPAGGAADNRMALARLRLAPGRYTAHFQTDGSHAWDDWSMDPPANPDLWGVQVWRAPEASGEGVAACALPGVPLPAGLE